MAGSIRPFVYTSDDGQQYKIKRDESNTETLNANSDQEDGVPPSSVGAYPSGYETRYALLYQVSDPQIKRKVTILSQTIFGELNGATDYSLQVIGSSNQDFRISALIGERRTGLTNSDTGQEDGDREVDDENDNDDG